MPVKVQRLSHILIGLPILTLFFTWNRLPDQLPLPFDEYGQADQLGNRQQWLTNVCWSVFFSSFLWSGFIYLVRHQQNLRAKQRVILYLLSAGFIAGASLLVIWQGIWGQSLYQQWTPVPFFLFGSGIVFYSVPSPRSTSGAK